jgi:hypothetical protein
MEAVFGEYVSLSDVEIMGAEAALVLDSLQRTTGTPNSIVQQLARTCQADSKRVAVKEQLYGRIGIQTAGVPRTLFTPLIPMQTIKLEVVRPIKFYNLMVPSESARYFTLLSATINGEEQLGAGPRPLLSYSEVSVRARFRWRMLKPGSPLLLRFAMNDITTERFFECTFLGAALVKTEERVAKAVDLLLPSAPQTLDHASQSDLFSRQRSQRGVHVNESALGGHH